MHTTYLPKTLGQEILQTHFVKTPSNSKQLKGKGGVMPPHMPSPTRQALVFTVLILFIGNLFNNHLPRRVVVHYWKLKSITAKIYKIASSIEFIKKSIYHEVEPTFILS